MPRVPANPQRGDSSPDGKLPAQPRASPGRGPGPQLCSISAAGRSQQHQMRPGWPRARTPAEKRSPGRQEADGAEPPGLEHSVSSRRLDAGSAPLGITVRFVTLGSLTLSASGTRVRGWLEWRTALDQGRDAVRSKWVWGGSPSASLGTFRKRAALGFSLRVESFFF